MSHSKSSRHSDTSTCSSTSSEIKAKLKGLFHRHPNQTNNCPTHHFSSNNMSLDEMRFRSKRQQTEKLTSSNSYTENNAGFVASSSPIKYSFEEEAKTFADYAEKLEEVLSLLKNMKREEYESETTLKLFRFLKNLIDQPKEWISGAKIKLCEMKFPEMALTLMNSYKEKGYLVRRIVFVHSILLYNTMSNFTDQEFDKEGLIRKQCADSGFIEFGCEILNDSSYRESLRKFYTITNPDEQILSEDFNNYQKILYICDSALTILYNLASLPELKIHFRECNAMTIIADYTNLPTNTIEIKFTETRNNEEYVKTIKELQDVVCAIRVTACLLLPFIMNEDEDNLLTANASEVLSVLSGMIQMDNGNNQRFYGFSFIELVDGISKLMVRGRTHIFIDKKLVKLLLNILKNGVNDNALLECVSNAILNAAFDENVQKILSSEPAVDIIRKTQANAQSQLVQKNCAAILWTLNRIPHKCLSTISDTCQLQGHIMISYNRSVTAMCLKIRDRLKALQYPVWLDVDNINGGVLESMAQAVENASIVLICMNEQYKQSYYCRLEAEYATELRKPCIPCLMQPRFRPYGWLGIIKGAKIHVDFATLPFEEAFSLLIREISTIRDVAMKNNNNSLPINSHQTFSYQSTVSYDLTNNAPTTEIITKQSNEQENGSISDWDATLVKKWLERCSLLHLETCFENIDGKLLYRLYQMKQLSADSYFKFINKHFDRIEQIQLSDILKFDYELECLFQ